MHRQTIDAYDQGADHWLRSRRGGDAHHEEANVARAFRAAVGDGLILDLGCGPGKLLDALGHPAIGLDASAGMLSLAASAGVSALVRGDLECLPFGDGCAAGAFANFSLQHLPRAGFATALSSVHRVLHAGGLLELTMHGGPHPDGVRTGDDMPVGRWFSYWSADDIESALSAAGFETVTIEHFGPGNRARAKRALDRT